MSVWAKEKEVTSASEAAQHSQVDARYPDPNTGLLEAGLLTGIPWVLKKSVTEVEYVEKWD